MDEAEHLGRRLQRARVRAGLTQQALCQRADLSYSTLTKIERGAIKSPSIFTIQSIAGALGVSLDDLIGGKALPRPKMHAKSGVSFVYFDMNGCLVGSFNRAFNRIAEMSGASADTIEAAFWRYDEDVCRGDMPIEEFNKIFAREVGLDNIDWQQLYLDAIQPIEGMGDMVRWVSERYHVGLLTNTMPGLVAAMRDQKLLPEVHYDTIIDSSEVHAVKPEPQMFEIAAAKAGRPAHEILLIDDSRGNIKAAQKQGWHVLWFNEFEPQESIKRIKDALQPAK